MRKLTSCILAGLLALCVALPVQAAPKDAATSMDTGAITGLYEGNLHNEFEDGLAVQIFDGHKRHYLYCRNYQLPNILKGKIGYTVRAGWQASNHPSEGVLPYLQEVSLVSGSDDPELNRIRTAAEENSDNNAKAQNTLGVWYEKGKHSLPKDPVEAVRWYTAAADREPLAMHNLGDCYRDGVGVARDEAKAIEWYNKAIEAGNPIGYEDLGNLYLMQGKRDEARAMYQKAAAAGRKSAQKKLAEMK